MADEKPQQTRVLLLNGQTLILQGNAGDNAVSEINTDLLQQALQEATGSSGTLEDPAEEEYNVAPNTESNENSFVAIFQGDQGETHTVQLTAEQAEALGLQFMANEEKQSTTVNLSDANPQLTAPSEETQFVYSESTGASGEEKQFFDQCVNVQNSVDNLSRNTSVQDDSSSALQQTMAGMGVLPTNYIGDSNNITLVSQVVNGQMTYTVKLNENQNQLQNQEFPVIEEKEEDNEKDKNVKLPLLASMPTSSISSGSSSSSQVVATSLSNIQLNSLSPSVTPLQPSSTFPKCAPGTSLLARTVSSTVQRTNSSFAFVPVSSPMSTAVSLVDKQGPTHLLRTVNRSQITTPQSLQSVRQGTNSTNGTSTSALTGIPLMNSNINITRTSSSSSGLLQSTSITGGGMIRVVAGGSATRIVPTTTSNGPKFTNILTPSGRLVAAAPVANTAQRIITVNTTTNLTRTVPVVTSTTPTSVPVCVSVVPATQATTTAALASTVAATESPSKAVVQSSPARVTSSSKPLGSSENPIQLVQHGQTFHSVQALSQEQLRQIATVLQQQQLDSASRSKNVLYDPDTNTRIIYRIVYPEDFDMHDPSSPPERAVSSTGVVRGRGRRGRPPKSAMRPLGRGASVDSSSSSTSRKTSADIDLDEDRLADDSSKGERKKQVARTRSGRLSRPPRHMVKDYKRLHHLDFADADLDDSDGGYSDYQMSDRELEESDSPTPSTTNALELFSTSTTITTSTSTSTGTSAGVTTTVSTVSQRESSSTGLLPGLQVPKRKISSHFRCPTCQKVYLGHSRMARHFEMYPDHGSIEQLNVPDKSGHHSTMNGAMRTGPGRRRGKRRGPWAYMTPEARSERRKIKLREVLSTCEAPELVEVAGPSVASVSSMWELLQLRVEAVRDESLVATMCEELRALLEKVQSVVGDVLQPITDSTKKEDVFDLQDEVLCNALGLPCGQYEIVDDQLLSRRGHVSYEAKLEPPIKRHKSEEDAMEDERSNKAQDERKPSCPEVLSALALDPKPAPVSNSPEAVSAQSPVTTTSPKESKEDSVIAGDTLQSTEKNLKVSKSPDGMKTENGTEVDPPFLLPSTTEMCVDSLAPESESEGQGQDLQTVDDIVNERLKNLTGFTVNGPESEPAPPAAATNAMETEVPTFDPEMALAAMGEGDQNVSGSSLSEFAPEIALAAMGEGSSGSEASPSAGPPNFAPSTPLSPTQESLSLDGEPQNCGSDETQQESCNARDAATEIFSSDVSMDISVSQSTEQAKETVFTTSVVTNGSENSFVASQAVDSRRNEPAGTVESFDPETALAAMGEGDGGSTTASTFDTEMALASMGEGDTPQRPRFQPPEPPSANDPEFQLTGMDVSLDGSGPELYFESLSAEFTQARHS